MTTFARLGRWALLVIVTTFSVSTGVTRAASAHCILKTFSPTVVPNDRGEIELSVTVAGQPALFILDTGASWSMIRASRAVDLPTERSHIEIQGFGGFATNRVAALPEISIGPWSVKHAAFFVGPEKWDPGPDVWGLIGADFLQPFDLELNLAENKVNFFLPSDCGDDVVYWPNSGIAKIPLEIDKNLIYLRVKLDGEDIKAIFDTGAYSTLLSLARADSLFDLTPGDPRLEAAGTAVGVDGNRIATYLHRFKKLQIGDLSFNDPWINIQEFRMRGRSADMNIGYHQMQQLRFYLATHRRVAYVTKAAPALADADPTSLAPGSIALEPKLDPVDAQLVVPGLKKAAAAANANDFVRAKAILDQSAATRPEYPVIFYRRAQIEFELKDYPAAKVDLDRAIKGFATYADAYQLRGSVNAAMQATNDAIADFDVAIRLKPGVATAHLERARLRMEAGQQDEALTDCNVALALDPKLEGAYLTRAIIHMRRSDYAYALEDYQGARDLNPANANAIAGVAICNEKLGRLEDADAAMRQAIALDPNDAQYHDQRCAYLSKAARWEEALSECARAVSLAPGSADYRIRRGQVLMIQKRFKEALADFDAALAVTPSSALALFERGAVKRQLGDQKGAKIDVAAAVALQPDIAGPPPTSKR